MGYWVSLVEPDKKHHELESMTMSISYNYSDLMSNLPCGWAREWQGKQAQDMIATLIASVNELENHRNLYKQFEKEPSKNLGTINVCLEILNDALNLFKEYPEGIIVVD
ncbi:hypothetical protein [Lactobacillus intestinalis]|nr:hypothetical protein [Lactobacillus intestinalis]